MHADTLGQSLNNELNFIILDNSELCDLWMDYVYVWNQNL